MKNTEEIMSLIALATAFIDEKTSENNNVVLSIRKDNKLYCRRSFDGNKATLDDLYFIQFACENKGFEVEFKPLER